MEKLMQRCTEKDLSMGCAIRACVCFAHRNGVLAKWEKSHYLRPEREYADKLNFKCPSCLKDAQVLGLREAISAQ